MSDPRGTVVPGDAADKKESDLAATDTADVKAALPSQTSEQKTELADSDLDKVAGGTAGNPGVMTFGGTPTLMTATARMREPSSSG